jgi:UDP-glucose 4-epimerase
MTKCVIIGGNGFIGSEASRLLALRGRVVQVMGRSPSPSRALHPGVEYFQGDYTDRKHLRSILEPDCEVINLAYSTVPKTSYDDPLHDLLTNLPANVGLLEECASVGVGKLVMVSSGGTVYGTTGTLPLSEKSTTMPVSPYGISKLSTELYALMFHRNTGLPAVVVRPANAYGESQQLGRGQGFIAEAVGAVIEGREIQIYGEHGTIRDYIHVSDVASGIVAALDHGNGGAVYNIGTGKGTSNLDIINYLRPLASSSSREIHCRTLSPRIFDVPANVLDSSILTQISGWVPRISIAEGIRRVWETRCRASAT